MPSKTEEYLVLAQRTANGLTRYWENWTDYLTTASRLYKYSFADQLMIYAQRPDATACASFDIWNNRMNRYVRRGSKGIALLDQSSSVPRLHYVFDVSDTGVRRNSRDPEVWQLGPDLMQPVSEMIAREYGVYHERLSQQISDLTGKLVDSYWDNNSGDILDIVDGSFLIDYDEAGQEFQFKSAAAISILYTVLERCGLEPDGHFDRDDFQAIFSFSTPAAVYALGTAVSECSRDVLRNIERTVKTTIRRRNVERSQYEYEQQERDLLDRRELPAPEPDPAPAGESTGQIRQTAPDLPDGASPGAVQFDAPVGDSAYAIADFRQLLFTLKSQGKTIIISEHRLYYLSGLFDRVLYLKDGEIEGDYTAEEFCGLSAKQRDDMGLRPLDLAGLSGIEGPPQRMNEAVWTIKNVSFAYKHEPETLHITETSFPSGSATAIIGHNGAGKSTFARCLCGLEKHFKGTVQDQSKNYSRKERLKLCYMVMQDVNHQLFTESVLDEILLSMRTEDKQRAREILQEMDLLPYEDCHPMGLSGGQKQRVAVASAIASERPLILFDEPTSGLDLFHMRQVANVVNQVANTGRTALVVTHDPEFILRCCNYVLHLENGQIQESYSIEDSDGRKRLLKFFLSDMKKEVSTK